MAILPLIIIIKLISSISSSFEVNFIEFTMKKYLFACLSVLISVGTFAQDPAVEFAESITQEDFKELLTIVASDAMEGRDTGERGQKMAAAFIADHFRRLGLQAVVPTSGGTSYYQKFDLQRRTPGNSVLIIDGETLENGTSTLYVGSANTPETVELETVYGGDGSEEALSEVDIAGKAVVVTTVLSGSARRDVSARAFEKGAALVLLETAKDDDEFSKSIRRYARYFNRGSLGFPAKDANQNGVFYVSPSMTAKALKTSPEKYEAIAAKVSEGDLSTMRKLKSGKVSFKAETNIEIVETENILGYLEGTDKKDELVVLTAHYDHVGRDGDKIYNGADDDGSGTTSILELAEAYVLAAKAGKGPRRSILFMTVTGEEKGLLGSQYYTENPVFPLENTVVNLNIDMVGRTDEAHKDNREFVYLVGSDRLSTELHELSEKANATYTKLDLDYTYNDENHPDRIYYRSDHWNFAKNNVPIIFYFNGTHEDYHQATDTVDKIEWDLLQKRAQLVFYTSWIIANRDQRLVVDKLSEATINNR